MLLIFQFQNVCNMHEFFGGINQNSCFVSILLFILEVNYYLQLPLKSECFSFCWTRGFIGLNWFIGICWNTGGACILFCISGTCILFGIEFIYDEGYDWIWIIDVEWFHIIYWSSKFSDFFALKIDFISKKKDEKKDI